MKLLGFAKVDDLQSAHKKWVEEYLVAGRCEKESEWTQSIAVGGKAFVEEINEKLGFQAKGRKICRENDHYQLREKIPSFSLVGFHTETGVLHA